MRVDLFTHPKVVRIASQLKADRLRTVGGLMAVWCLFDAHSVDGRLDGYALDTVDELIGWAGFSAAMKMVGWIVDQPDGLMLPEFDTHNGQSAKRRAQDADRKRAGRASASEADKKQTRGQESTEELTTPHTPLAGGDGIEQSQSEKTTSRKPAGKAAVSLKAFLAECKSRDERPIPEGDPVFAYADEVGIPDDFLRLHWLEFKERHSQPVRNATRTGVLPTAIRCARTGTRYGSFVTVHAG
jgi:hypothetical protein